jgi:hypothetical protein
MMEHFQIIPRKRAYDSFFVYKASLYKVSPTLFFLLISLSGLR